MLGSFIRVEGKDIKIKKDFENLRILAGIIHQEQFVQTAHIDPNGQAIAKLDVAQDWNPINKRTTISFDYMKKILHDIDIAINKGGEGETFGVTHQLVGEHVQEMEAFMEHYDENNY